jgi:amino acid adenylation domain-containing protein
LVGLNAKSQNPNPKSQIPTVQTICITYRELNRKSGWLADYLNREGVQTGDLVGLMTDRSIDMIVGILGILKAGCAYVPLNPDAPAARNRFILTDCNIKLLLTNCLSLELNRGIEVIDLSDLIFDRYAADVGNRLACSAAHLRPSCRYAPTASLAYVIYTSGSTGKPRGVPVTHANFSPLLHWGYKYLGLSPSDRSAQNLAYYFDWSVWEMFIVLTSGASLHMVPGEVVPDPGRYIDFIHGHAITVLHITPTHMQSLLHVTSGRKLSTLNYLCIGAEKLNCDLLERCYDHVNEGCRVFNMYGPTEATIMAAVLEIDKSKLPFYNELSSVPIGKTLGNNVLLVLDRHSNPCPLSVPGSCISEATVSPAGI